MIASPMKLRSGDWGVRIPGTPKKGDSIEVASKSGKRWTAVVERVVWTDGSVSIVATMQRQRDNGPCHDCE